MRTRFGRRRDTVGDGRGTAVPVPSAYVDELSSADAELMWRVVDDVERILRDDVRMRGPEARWWVSEWSSRALSHRMHLAGSAPHGSSRQIHARALAQMVADACSYWGIAPPTVAAAARHGG